MENISYYASLIYKYMNTGEERIVNESLHFGLGYMYAWVKDLNESGVPYEPMSNALFGRLKPENLEPYLEFLYKWDGYLLLNQEEWEDLDY